MSMTIGRPPAADPVVPVPIGGGLVAELGVEPRRRGLNFWKTLFLCTLPVTAAVYVWLAATGIHGVMQAPPEAAPVVYQEPDGAALYIQHCARCHGARGDADGFASPHLEPPARRFGAEKFQFASTPNAVPTDADLAYIIHHGIPGTAMPPFDFLTAEQKLAVANHVRRLAYAGLYNRLWEEAAKDEDPEPKEIHAMTVKRLTAEPELAVPAGLPAPDESSVTRGKELFVKSCVACHGAEGKGDGKDVASMKNPPPKEGGNGRPTRPRDLTRGLFKAGGEPERLYKRIALGIPGTPMPASSTLKPNEIGDLVNFVRSLSRRPAGNEVAGK